MESIYYYPIIILINYLRITEAPMGSLSLLDKVCFFLIFVMGIPHGALDGAVAGIVGIKSKRDYSAFALSYLLSSFFVMISWYFFPGLSLLAFLLLTIFHFGSCDWLNYGRDKNKFLVVFTHGMVVMFGIVAFHQSQSVELFSLLAGRRVDYVRPYFMIPISLAFIAFIVYAFKSIKQSYLRAGVCELFVVLTVAYNSTILAAFAVYFCFIHSVKHVKHILSNIDKKSMNYRKICISSLIFTVVSWLMAFVAFDEFSSSYSTHESLLKVVFIGLASLTLPHMILIEKFHKKSFQMVRD